ncbi:hypothetical protein RJE46_14150 [Cedecea neteri]|uniref:hypothetical protein n=1 Tax=Cedecea neteri TaxID=158822 RepID=UPI002892D61B|nr:hypothetical protein [Cedecea neteri]WNJ77774.1 hypothetical protein RJE46_14150 [Cedecea neteri]
MTTVYVTKYALTTGAFYAEGAKVDDDKKSASFRDANGFRWFLYGKDFWLTPEEALADCERRRDAKLKSIEKQTKKLQSMKFEIKKS